MDTRDRIKALLQRKATGNKTAALLDSVVLQPHQDEAAGRIATSPGGSQLLYHGTGTGKSLSSLAGVERLPGDVNVVVPATLRINYDKELKKFVTPQARGRYDVGSYDRAAKAGLPDKPVLVADEVQRLRNQGRAYSAVLAAAQNADNRVLLSATPLVNAPGDLAAIVNLLHGQQLYTPSEFESRFTTEKIRRPILGLFGKAKVEPALKHEKELKALLEGRVHYVGGDQAAKPTSSAETVPVEMSPLQDRLTKAMEGKLPFWLRYKVRHNLPPTKQQATQLNAFMSGMRQVALSPYGFDRRLDPLKAYQQSPKLQAAMSRIESELQAPTGKVMAYTNFVSSGITPMEAALKEKGIPYSVIHGQMNDKTRKAQIDAYNSGKSRVILLGPAASEGLSLKGTSRVLTLDPTWNQARRDQAEARAIRLDSHNDLPPELRNVKIDRLISEPRRRLWRRLLGIKPAVSSDSYLYARADEKQRLLSKLNTLLQQVGSENG